ncbi:MAG: hypothetical protein CVT66_00450 [Actinobacteria bacterium HGW-Actinobacteria-6]|jgi:hypothetical protein|nr:MAG: hypothetical protein CVT66_00450 [Actinobacteria bacterium HGW-Actinobacteria-6]
MPAGQNQNAVLLGLGRRFGAWLLLIVVGWIALGIYGDYRADVTRQKDKPAASSEATSSAEATDSATSGEEGGAAEEVVKKTVIVVAEGLNFRENPDTGSKVIKKLKRGTSLDLLETRSGWYRVMDADGDEGWIASGTQYSKLAE